MRFASVSMRSRLAAAAVAASLCSASAAQSGPDSASSFFPVFSRGDNLDDLHRRSLQDYRPTYYTDENAPSDRRRYPWGPYARTRGESESSSASSFALPESDGEVLSQYTVRWGRCVAATGVDPVPGDACAPCSDCRDNLRDGGLCVCDGAVGVEYVDCVRLCEAEACADSETVSNGGGEACDIEACHELERSSSMSSSGGGGRGGGPAKFFAEFEFCPPESSGAAASGASPPSGGVSSGFAICDACAEACEGAAYDDVGNNNDNNIFAARQTCARCVSAECASALSSGICNECDPICELASHFEAGADGADECGGECEETIDECLRCLSANPLCKEDWGAGGDGGNTAAHSSSGSWSCLPRVAPLFDYLSASVEYFQREQITMCRRCKDECEEYNFVEESRPCYVCPEECEELSEYEQVNAEVPQELIEMCARCGEGCEEHEEVEIDPGAPDCGSCLDECYKIENMEENGYVDAKEFIFCQMIYEPPNPSENGNGRAPTASGWDGPLYAGPVCANSGTKVKIGIFLDEGCTRLDPSVDVDDYLTDGDGYQMKLSHALLKGTYARGRLLSCLGGEDEQGPKKACSLLRESSAPKPEYVLSLVYDYESRQETPPPFVMASVDAEAFRPDGTPIPAGDEGGPGLLLRSVWAEAEGPDVRRQRKHRQKGRRRRAQEQDEQEWDEMEEEVDEYEEYYGDENVNDAAEAEDEAEWFEEQDENAEWFEERDDDERDRSYADAEVRFAFLPPSVVVGAGDGEWWLHSSFLSDRRSDDENNAEGYSPAPWIYNSVGPNPSEIGNIGGGGGGVSDGGGDEGVLLHCETVEFTYVEADSGDGPEGGAPFGTVRLHDVIMGPHDRYNRPSVCGRRIYNPCDEMAGAAEGGGELVCRMKDALIDCLPQSEAGRTSPSPIPGLTRREYLEAYTCSHEMIEDDDHGGGNDGVYIPQHDANNENQNGNQNEHEEEHDEWKEEGGGDEMSYWDGYALFPMKCVIVDGEEMVLYSFYRQSWYGGPCEDSQWNSTQLAPVTDFVRAYLGSILQGQATPNVGVDCVRVDSRRGVGGVAVGGRDDDDAWVRVGCSPDLSDRGLFVNAYSDDECTEGRRALEAAELQIPFQACAMCGSRWPWQRDEHGAEGEYVEADDDLVVEEIEMVEAEEGHDDHDDHDHYDHNNNGNNGNNNSNNNDHGNFDYNNGYSEEGHDDHDEHNNNNSNGFGNLNSNNNGHNGGGGGRGSSDSGVSPNNIQCSDLFPARWLSCDAQCQLALLNDAETSGTDLYWRGQFAFLQASAVTATANGTDLLFVDDLGRPEYINSGGEGEEISREDFWTESGQKRGVKFYFYPNDVPSPSADQAAGRGWNLYEARMYAYDGETSDWIYWRIPDRDPITGDPATSDIRVPPGKSLFYCDYVEFNFEPSYWSDFSSSGVAEEDSAGKFVGHEVYIGAYLPGYPPYEVCDLEVHNPCRNLDDGTHSLCRAIDGRVSCVDMEEGANNTAPAVSARSSPAAPAGDLHCSEPAEVPVPDPATLEWRGEYSYLYARSASANYSNGGGAQFAPLAFDDLSGRAEVIDSGEAGELLERGTSWTDSGNGVERRFMMSFVPSSPYSSESGRERDNVATWGWRMNETLLLENDFFRPRWLSSPNSMIGVPAGRLVFHCEYVEFNFKRDYRYYGEEEDETSMIWDPSRQNQAASFVARDVVIGAYLPENYDICSQWAYNPCRDGSGGGGTDAGRVCRAVDGQVSCVAGPEEEGSNNPPTATARSGAGAPAAGLPVCGEAVQAAGADDAGAPTPSPNATASPTADHDDPQTTEEPSTGAKSFVNRVFWAGLWFCSFSFLML